MPIRFTFTEHVLPQPRSTAFSPKASRSNVNVSLWGHDSITIPPEQDISWRREHDLIFVCRRTFIEGFAITGKGNFSGTVTLTFNIVKK